MMKDFLKKKHVKDILEVILAFFIAWLAYQGIAFAANTSMPIVSVVSDSMLPNLHRGDLLAVYGTNDYEAEDIAIYQRPGTKFTIVHRIKEITDEGYVFKGDNNPTPDPYIVKREQIIGKVAFAVPLLGYPRLALSYVGI